MKKTTEKIAGYLFLIFGCIAIVSVGAITIYMLVKGVPALREVGIPELIFGTVWEPTASNPRYGIFYIILSSVVGTFGAVLLGVPIGILTAVFLTDFTNESKIGRRISSVLSAAVELLAAIPSVIYGLIGMMVLNPLMYRLEKGIYAGNTEHQFTGGSNLLSAIIVLAIMILPTVINISTSALKAVPPQLKSASLAIGASHVQTIFKVMLPTAKSGIISAIILGVGRAIGEAMAITLVSGSSVNIPLPFNSVRFLTTAIVAEMGYAGGTHRQVLFTIGLVLFAFIMLINVAMTKLLKSREVAE